jgi:hypothetical protein
MRRKWAWSGAIAAAALATWFVGWFPYYRLDREVAAARSEGLWTEPSDIPRGIHGNFPQGENAAPLVAAAISMARPRDFDRQDVSTAMKNLLKGSATNDERAKVRLALLANPELLASWRAAAECPRLDFGRDWSRGYATFFPELSGLKRGAQLLAAAAALGLEPKENLRAAARLSVLARQEPAIIAQIVSVSMGRIVLKEAKREGVAPEIESALGPPIDVRWAYAGELAMALDTMRRVGSPEWFREMGTSDTRGFLERMRNAGPWKANAAFRVVHDHREFWREMPKQGDDYDTAIRAIDRWIPRIDDELAGASPILGKLMSTPADASEAVKAIRNFEAERRAVRKP